MFVTLALTLSRSERAARRPAGVWSGAELRGRQAGRCTRSLSSAITLRKHGGKEAQSWLGKADSRELFLSSAFILKYCPSFSLNSPAFNFTEEKH